MSGKKSFFGKIDLTILIPCYNESKTIGKSLNDIIAVFKSENIKYEILCVNNASTDLTESILRKFEMKYSFIRFINTKKKGYGIAIKAGLKSYRGDALITVMADGSEDPKDIVSIYKKLDEGYDCVCGNRFKAPNSIKNYPKLKLLLNRLGNRTFASILGLSFNDLTYAFKCYKADHLKRVKPLKASSFNINLELFMNVYFTGASVGEVDVTWQERQGGVSKFNLVKECYLNFETFLRVYMNRNF